MLWNCHCEFGSCFLLEHSLIRKKHNKSELNIYDSWDTVVRQHILGVVDNVYCTVRNLTGFPAVKEFWQSGKIWRSYRHERAARFLRHGVDYVYKIRLFGNLFVTIAFHAKCALAGIRVVIVFVFRHFLHDVIKNDALLGLTQCTRVALVSHICTEFIYGTRLHFNSNETYTRDGHGSILLNPAQPINLQTQPNPTQRHRHSGPNPTHPLAVSK